MCVEVPKKMKEEDGAESNNDTERRYHRLINRGSLVTWQFAV